MSLKALKEQFAAKSQEMRDMHAKAKEESRPFTKDEDEVYGQRDAELETLKQRIKQEERDIQLAKDQEILGQATEDEQRTARREQNAMAQHEDDPTAPLDSGQRSRAFRSWAVGGRRSNDRDRQLQERGGLMPGENADMVFHRGFDEFGEAFPAPRSIGEANAQYEARLAAEREQRVQELDPASAGGFLVPNAMMRSLEIARLRYGGMRRVAEVIQTDTGATLPMPTNNDTAQTGEWVAEGIEVSDQDAAFASVDLVAYLCSSKFVGVSYQLMQDSATSMAALLGNLLGIRCGRTENTGFTNGTGSGQPRGMTLDAVDSTITTASNTAFIFDELLDLKHSVDPEYRDGGIGAYMCADATLGIIKKMKDSQGRPLFLPRLHADAPDTFDGDDLIINQDMPTGASAKAVVYGDLSNYKIREVRRFEVMRLNELLARFHQVAFLGYTRVDGRLLNAGTHPVKYLSTPA